MEIGEIIQNGRKYRAYVSPDEQAGAYIVIGPPEGLVDALELPEPHATKLHNILYDRQIFTFEDASRRGVLTGVLQELFALDTQLLLEKFNDYRKETVV